MRSGSGRLHSPELVCEERLLPIVQHGQGYRPAGPDERPSGSLWRGSTLVGGALAFLPDPATMAVGARFAP